MLRIFYTFKNNQDQEEGFRKINFSEFSHNILVKNREESFCARLYAHTNTRVCTRGSF